ncbi:Uncharacterised protein [Burkholderia pseudomallei]|nr:Uncharacterised protein [Burkholderia pseudomallei]CAJ9655521.1 Uncharacterised protein [Burkholderia pseudomallei]
MPGIRRASRPATRGSALPSTTIRIAEVGSGASTSEFPASAGPRSGVPAPSAPWQRAQNAK